MADRNRPDAATNTAERPTRPAGRRTFLITAIAGAAIAAPTATAASPQTPAPAPAPASGATPQPPRHTTNEPAPFVQPTMNRPPTNMPYVPPPRPAMPAGVAVRGHGPATSFRWSDNDWIARVTVTITNRSPAPVSVDPDLFRANANGTEMIRWSPAASIQSPVRLAPGQSVTGTLAWYYNAALARPTRVTITAGAAFRHTATLANGPDMHPPAPTSVNPPPRLPAMNPPARPPTFNRPPVRLPSGSGGDINGAIILEPSQRLARRDHPLDRAVVLDATPGGGGDDDAG
jgi:hypothetical protein